MKHALKKTRKSHEIKENEVDSHGESETYPGLQEEIGAILFKEFGDSVSSIYRYIRLNFLTPELPEVMDANRMRLLTAVELSYFSKEHQQMIYRYFYGENRVVLTPELLPEIKESVGRNALNENKLNQMVSKANFLKKRSGSLTLKKKFVKKYAQYFDDKTQMLKTIKELPDRYVEQKNKK